MVQITHFDGVQLSTVGIAASLPLVGEPNQATNISLDERIDSFPEAISFSFREKNLLINLTPTAGTSSQTFYTNVNRYFTPNGGTFSNKRLRVIQGLHDDASTVINASCYINTLQRTAINLYQVSATIPKGKWATTTLTTDSATPVVNNGNVSVFPNIALSFASNARYRSITFTVLSTRLGIQDYPVTFTADTTGVSAASASNYIFFMNGVSVPITISAANNASSKFWVRVNCPSGTTVTGYLFYGSTVSSDKCQLFGASDSVYQAGGMDLTNSTNSSWIWTGSDILTYPFSTGVWKPGKIGISQEGTSYGMTFSSTAWNGFSIENDNSLANDADCMLLVVGHNGAGTSNALSGFVTQLTLEDSDGIIRYFVKYRVKNNPAWITKEATSIDSTTVSSFPSVINHDHTVGAGGQLDIDNAVEIAIGLEAQEGQPRGSLTIGNIALTLAVTAVSTSVGGANNAWVAPTSFPVLTLTGVGTMKIREAYVSNTSFDVDCDNKKIVYSGSNFGIMSITFEDFGEGWLSIPPGSTAFAWSGSGTPSTTTFTYYNGYSL